MWIFILLAPPPLIIFSYFTVFLFDNQLTGLGSHLFLHPIWSTNIPIVMILIRVLYPGNWFMI